MQRIRIVGLCLLAVFAVSAVAASGASASNFLFKEPAGKFPVSFTSSGGTAELITIGGQKVVCTGVSNSGEILNSTLGLVLIKFTGCKTKVSIFTFKCSNAATEEIEVHLKFHLGKALPSGNPAILLLLPGGKFNFECEGQKIEVTGEVVGLLLEHGKTTPVKANTAYSEVDLSFKQSSQGKQEDQTFDLSPGNEEMTSVHLSSSLNGGTAEEASEVATDTLSGFKDSGGKSISLELAED